MPVQIQCIAVIIRNEALDRCIDGGAANFASIAPNGMSYGDDRLCQASFMSPLDAEEFAKNLELRGLNRHGPDPDFVIVDAHDQPVHSTCDWLVLFEYEGRQIATVVGSTSTTVIAPASGADASHITHFSADEANERLEFVERDGVIDVYRDKITGQLLYHTRQTETDAEIFRQAFHEVWQHHRLPGSPPASAEAQTALSSAIEKLQHLASRHPEASDVALGLGIGWFAKGNCARALESFSRAAKLAPEDTNILKEWAGVCLVTTDFASALDIGRRAVVLKPDDPELLANYAVIQLFNRRVEEARETIARALQLDPTDSINQNVQKIIMEVSSGLRPCPRSLAEMTEPVRPKTWLRRLLGLK